MEYLARDAGMIASEVVAILVAVLLVLGLAGLVVGACAAAAIRATREREE